MYWLFVPLGFIIGGIVGNKVKRNRKIYKIKFVPESEKDKILSKEGFTIPEESKCPICGDKVTKGNIGIITKKSGQIIIVCNKSKCLKLNKIATQQ